MSPRGERVDKHNGMEFLKTSHHSAKFCGQRHCGSGDMMILVCQVMSQDHITKGTRDLMGRKPSRKVTILPSLETIHTLVVAESFLAV